MAQLPTPQPKIPPHTPKPNGTAMAKKLHFTFCVTKKMLSGRYAPTISTGCLLVYLCCGTWNPFDPVDRYPAHFRNHSPCIYIDLYTFCKYCGWSFHSSTFTHFRAGRCSNLAPTKWPWHHLLFPYPKTTGLNFVPSKKLGPTTKAPRNSTNPPQKKKGLLAKGFLVGGFNPSAKYYRQNGNLPQAGMNIKKKNHHLDYLDCFSFSLGGWGWPWPKTCVYCVWTLHLLRCVFGTKTASSMPFL